MRCGLGLRRPDLKFGIRHSKFPPTLARAGLLSGVLLSRSLTAGSYRTGRALNLGYWRGRSPENQGCPTFGDVGQLRGGIGHHALISRIPPISLTPFPHTLPMRRLFFLLFLLPWLASAQDDEPRKYDVGGYVKYLHSATFADLPVPGTPPGFSYFPLTNNFFHHRLNLFYYPKPAWTVSVQMRNRLFWGEQVKLDPTFGQQIDQYPGLLDLSVRWVDNENLLLHSIFDRAYLKYSQDKWDITLGRQRINWGVTTIWNPNDLFNALNFLDFDYEERPGNDALRIQYFPGILSRAEIAIAPGRYDSTWIAAGLYRFNAKGYDVQVLGGYYNGDLAVGGGWEGSIGAAGFKGEGTYFTPLEGLSPDTSATFSGALSADYMLSNGLYLSGGLLYNQRGGEVANGQTASLFTGTLNAQPLSPKNLFPAEWTFSLTASGQPHPLVSLNGTVLYSPQDHLTVAVPTVSYSIKENWALDLVGQVFLSEVQEDFQHVASSVFFRLKWSY